MNGVSCRALGVAIDGAKQGRFSLETIVAGLDTDVAYISNPGNRIPWDLFATIMDRLEIEIGGTESLRKLGEENVTTTTFSPFLFVGRALSHPRDIYFMGAKWMGPSLFPMITAQIRELPDGTLLQQLTLADGHRPCPALFHVLHGSLASGPAVLGHGYSDVSLDLTPNGARFLIHPKPTSNGWPGKIFRAVRARLAIPSMLKELEQQTKSLGDNYVEIRKAHDQIATQAADLAKVNSIGRRLSEHIDLGRVADVLIRIMIEELQIVGVELSVIRNNISNASTSLTTTQPSPFSRRGGQIFGPSTHHYLLVAAGQPLGTLHVWRTADQEKTESPGLFDRLLPWITLALDNARRYDALELHAADLEERVNERTARLLAANHHLVREIDERNRATDALVHSEAQLRASERLASIGTLAAGIAHEINNPIGSILAAAQLAQLVRTDGDDDAQVSASLMTIVEQTKRCGEIVRSVLQFSRNEPTQKWVSKINDVVARSIKLTEGFALEHQARIEFDIPAITVWARINPIQIEQAVVNLIRNAIESGAKQITVNIDEDRRDASVTIQVRDNGPGVDDSDRPRIFDPFYTTKQNVGGTGLGLSVVHGIAAEHGGSLKIAATRDPGTTIRFDLPTCPAPASPLADKPDDPDTPTD